MELVKDISFFQALGARFKDYMILAKMRLNLTVVFSAVIGFLFAGMSFGLPLLYLALGGFLITASSNTINQIFEKDYDALMKRTQNRPLPTGRLSVVEASLFAGLTGLVGLAILWLAFNPLAAVLGMLALISYAFVYTPLKRMSPIAVFVGAIPGALPPMIGYVAATGSVNFEAWMLFAFQFLWQFPHFWAIAWVAFDDYKRAGFKLLPDGEKTTNMPIQSMIYIIALIGLVALPAIMNMIGIVATIVIVAAGLFYFMPAYKLYKYKEDKYAKKLMYASFLYLPVVLLALLIG